MTIISAQDFFRAEDLPADAELPAEELQSAFWQLKRMQRESQQQQVFWKSVNESMSDAYAKLGAFQDELKASKQDLREANARLEEKVSERTAELTAQLERIQAQQETIRALFTPIIRVWERVLVLPIIGSLDRDRAAEITHNLLHAVVASRSAYAILDLTGVADVDAETADHLIRIHGSVRMLGAQCLLSGLSAGVARSFANLNADLHNVVSFGALHTALQHALLRMGELPSARPQKPSARG